MKYLRKQRGLTQKQASKLSGIHFETYSKFEAGTRGLSSVNLEKVMDALNGTLMVAPFKFDDRKLDTEFPNDNYGSNGVTLSQAYLSCENLLSELPNMFMHDEVPKNCLNGLKMYLKGIIGKQALAQHRIKAEERYAYYDELENGEKLSIETKTKSLEMIVMNIVVKTCSIPDFQDVPDMVENLLK